MQLNVQTVVNSSLLIMFVILAGITTVKKSLIKPLVRHMTKWDVDKEYGVEASIAGKISEASSTTPERVAAGGLVCGGQD